MKVFVLATYLWLVLEGAQYFESFHLQRCNCLADLEEDNRVVLYIHGLLADQISYLYYRDHNLDSILSC